MQPDSGGAKDAERPAADHGGGTGGTPGSALSDAELITLVRGGNRSAFGVLYGRHAPAAANLARQFARSASEADDLVSEAFARMLDNLLAGKGPDTAFRAYLFTTLRHTAYDRSRKDGRLLFTDDITAHERVEVTDDPFARGLEAGLVARAFGSLPERWQTVLWHTEVEGETPQQVGEVLGLTPNAVTSLAFRAREGLREAYLQAHLADTAAERCRATVSKLGGYVRGGLSRRETTQVEAHLEECDRCRSLVAELSEMNHSLRAFLAPLILGGAAAGYLGMTPTAHAATPIPGAPAQASAHGPAGGTVDGQCEVADLPSTPQAPAAPAAQHAPTPPAAPQAHQNPGAPVSPPAGIAGQKPAIALGTSTAAARRSPWYGKPAALVLGSAAMVAAVGIGIMIFGPSRGAQQADPAPGTSTTAPAPVIGSSSISATANTSPEALVPAGTTSPSPSTSTAGATSTGPSTTAAPATSQATAAADPAADSRQQSTAKTPAPTTPKATTAPTSPKATTTKPTTTKATTSAPPQRTSTAPTSASGGVLSAPAFTAQSVSGFPGGTVAATFVVSNPSTAASKPQKATFNPPPGIGISKVAIALTPIGSGIRGAGGAWSAPAGSSSPRGVATIDCLGNSCTYTVPASTKAAFTLTLSLESTARSGDLSLATSGAPTAHLDITVHEVLVALTIAAGAAVDLPIIAGLSVGPAVIKATVRKGATEVGPITIPISADGLTFQPADGSCTASGPSLVCRPGAISGGTVTFGKVHISASPNALGPQSVTALAPGGGKLPVTGPDGRPLTVLAPPPPETSSEPPPPPPSTTTTKPIHR